MAKYGYILKTSNPNVNAQYIGMMESFGCKIYTEECFDEHDRPVWCSLVRQLQPMDEVYVSKFGNAFRGARELVFFLHLCISKNIRLYCVKDDLDTNNPVMYKVFAALSAMTKDITAVRHEVTNTIGKRKRVLKSTPKRRTRLKRDADICNMYTAGVPISKIQKEYNIKYVNTIYVILRRHGVETNRHKKKTTIH